MASKLIGNLFCPPPLPDTCTETFPLVSMGGWAEGLTCADPGARAPIGASRNYISDRNLDNCYVYQTLIYVGFIAEKYRKAEYVWPPCSGLGMWHCGKWYFEKCTSFIQGQAEWQDKHLAMCLYSTVYWYKSCRLCLLYVVFSLCTFRNWFFTMCMMITFCSAQVPAPARP